MGNCSTGKGSIKKPLLSKSTPYGKFKTFVENEAGSDYGDDTSIGEDYFRIDMQEEWAPVFMQKYARNHTLPKDIQTLHIARLQGDHIEVNQFL